ncbi:zinc finger, CCHC-type containing protein [Tanacetum coccineum]|uniref:Zinc finger, CCHC-type containing protein n=1 Tax=Tanacetum coccineum TaxID=301880 RepID=A0ABQ5DQI3_9ASTR
MGRAKSTMYNGKSRHIRRRHNSIRQLLSTGVISIDYVASKDNIVDPFTKGLSRELVTQIVWSDCTTALDACALGTDGESVLRESCLCKLWKHETIQTSCGTIMFWMGLIVPLYMCTARPRTAKELWESLESQVQDLQVLLKQTFIAEGNDLSETSSVAAIIESYLKLAGSEDTYTPESAKANMVEHAGSSSRFNSKGNKKDKRKNDKKGKGKSEYLAPKAGIVKQKFQGTCYNCDQPGHRAANCKMPKRANPRQANMVNDDVDMIAMVSDVVAMISEVNLVKSGLDNGKSCIWDILQMLIARVKIRKNLAGRTCGGSTPVLTATYLLNRYLVRKEETPMNYGWEKTNHINTYECGGGVEKSTAYRFIVHESKNPDIQKNTIMESRNASFFENIFPCLSKGTGSSSRLDDKVVQDKRQRDDNDSPKSERQGSNR